MSDLFTEKEEHGKHQVRSLQKKGRPGGRLFSLKSGVRF
jgi:hypothetical protein